MGKKCIAPLAENIFKSAFYQNRFISILAIWFNVFNKFMERKRV